MTPGVVTGDLSEAVGLTDWDVEDVVEVLAEAGEGVETLDLSGNELTGDCLQPLCLMLVRGGAPNLRLVKMTGQPELRTMAAELLEGLRLARPDFAFEIGD